MISVKRRNLSNSTAIYSNAYNQEAEVNSKNANKIKEALSIYFKKNKKLQT